MEKRIFSPEDASFPACAVDFVGEALAQYQVNKKLRTQAMLLFEEGLVLVRAHMAEGASVSVRVKKTMGEPVIEIGAKGTEFDLCELAGDGHFALPEQEDAETEDAIRSIIIKAYGDRLKYKNRNGTNKLLISVGEADRRMLYYTFGALLLAVVIGFLFRLAVPAAVNGILCDYVFSPIKTMFINALKIIVGPVVFFSIVTCISQFQNLSELGRIGAKVMGMYFLTTIFAVALGVGVFQLLQPGTFGMALSGSAAAQEVAVDLTADTSILGTIIGIVPDNFVKPFLEADTLQIIFLAVLVGVAVGMIGTYSKTLKDFFEACNSLALTITSLISKLIPLAVFAAVFLMIVQTGSGSLLAMLGMLGSELVAVAGMLLIYGLLILLLGRLNPLPFFKKNGPGMLTAFSLSSSSAAMPTNLAICENSLGISNKVSSFSIPLGATVNMDGTSIHLALAALFLAKMYGVEVPATAMVSIVITILMLSIGTPGVAGASLVCLGVLLNQIGVPIEALGLIMGVDSLLDMLRTMSNTTGDMAVTLIVAKSEGLVDLEKYNKSNS